MRRAVFLLTVVILAISCSASARTWYILPDSTGDAPTIQAGVDSASAGDTVLVACGTYHDCTHQTWVPTEGYHCVIMKSGICLRSETGEPDCATIEAWRPDSYLRRVILCYNVDETASIEGFTITGGFLDDPDGVPDGAGIYCENSSPRIANCFFSENEARYGGAIWCDEGSPMITDCTFSGNTAGFGGAIACAPSATVTNCVFISNDGDMGGAIGWSSSYYNRGSGTVANCVFWENRAPYGPYGGGGILCWESSLIISDCTFFGNCGANSGGMLCTEFSTVEIENTIIAFGRSGNAVGCDEGSSATLTCCAVYGNAEGDWVGYIADQYGINGNLSADPLFCDTAIGDFTLDCLSPCAPAQQPECGLIGAWVVGCGASRTEPTTWGAIKAMYK